MVKPQMDSGSVNLLAVDVASDCEKRLGWLIRRVNGSRQPAVS